MDSNGQKLLTIGQIADMLREPPTRVQYIVAKYRIKPAQRVGIFRLFDEGQIKAIQQGLFGIQIRADHGK